MKRALSIAAAMALFASAACEEPPPLPIRRLQNIQINNGIIRQRTVFPYHFVPATARLNPIGDHDLEVLSVYFKDHPGKLNIRRGKAGQKLYDARVGVVIQTLAAAGVDINRIEVVDELVPGDAMVSERVVRILEKEAAGPPPSPFELPASFSIPPSTGDIPPMK